MTVKSHKPTSPGRRFFKNIKAGEITRDKPEKALLGTIKKSGGRNVSGRITVRHRGGGDRRKYRMIDFKRDKDGIPAKVATIEYDPNRSSNIALLHYADGDKRYVLAPVGLSLGEEIVSGKDVEIKPGNALPLRHIPLGTQVHNIELNIGHGAQLVRAAGGSARLMAKEGKFAQVKLSSGEVRLIPLDCKATIGQVGNIENESVNLGKAGRGRWKGRRPRVRGVAMNPVDHPHGGGEGKSSGGRHPVTPWGVPTKGYKTRTKKTSDRMIVKKRR